MANLTVSTDVDTMMQAANNAGIRSAIGVTTFDPASPGAIGGTTPGTGTFTTLSSRGGTNVIGGDSTGSVRLEIRGSNGSYPGIVCYNGGTFIGEITWDSSAFYIQPNGVPIQLQGRVKITDVLEMVNVSSLSTVTGASHIGAISGTMCILNDGGTTRAIALNSEVMRAAVFTVGTLPSGTQGDRAAVTDSLVPTFLATVAAGGSAFTPVIYDGSNWICA